MTIANTLPADDPVGHNYLMTITPDELLPEGYEVVIGPMPSLSPVPFVGGFWLSVYVYPGGDIGVNVSPLPVDVGPPR